MKRLVIALVLISFAGASAAQGGLRVGIYSGTGAEPDKTLALYRAVAPAGHIPMAIARRDLVNGRLTTSNFDFFILPAGQDGRRCCADHYSDDGDALGSIPANNAIRDVLNSGGGMVAIEAGAYFAAKNGGTLESWHSYGGGYFEATSSCTVVAENASGQPVIVRDTYGAGRLLSHPDPFRDQILLDVHLASPQPVQLTVYDVKGTLVSSLANRRFGAGNHRFTWDGTDDRDLKVPHGVYFVRLKSEDRVESEKVVFITRK